MLSSIELNNFKSHQSSKYEFDDKTTAIVGPNASGKTNILEAVYFSFLTKSFRSSKYDFIRYEEDYSKVIADFFIDNKNTNIEHRIRKNADSVTSTMKLNGVNKKAYDIIGLQPVVIFVPEDLRIVADGPQYRRNLINNIIIQSSNDYLMSLSRFQKILNQRNRLLYKIKHIGQGSKDQVFVYNLQMSDPVETIYKYRKKIISFLSDSLSDIYSSISGTASVVNIEYVPTLPSLKDEIFVKLDESTNNDMRLGYTSLGPHKDEINIKLNGQDSRGVLSRGECRTLTLAIKILELNYLRENTSKSPILLLDDVLSELDKSRQKRLLEASRGQQTIITSTHIDDVVYDMKVIEL